MDNKITERELGIMSQNSQFQATIEKKNILHLGPG
jgi:hypothetical protein